MSKNGIIGISIAVVIIAIIGFIFWTQYGVPTKDYTAFAKCIGEKGAKFYGAFWCPHCQAQKALFGNAAKDLPYVECSTPDSNGQLQICNDEKIELYPTWKFADGSVQQGEMTLQALADKTGCALP